MVVTSFSTSAECASMAGMKALSATTFPKEADVDNLRGTVSANIKSVIGQSTADVGSFAKFMEMGYVKRAIIQIKKNVDNPTQATDYNLDLTAEDEQRLLDHFNIDQSEDDAGNLGFVTWIPGENEN